MRFVLALLAVLGIAASALALREHYRTDTSPCSINEKWDCGIVNHSPYAVLWGVPVATIGIAGYLLMGVLALKRWYLALLPLSLAALAFSLYLAHIEAHLLGVWCIYCVASLGVISVFSLLVLGTVVARTACAASPRLQPIFFSASSSSWLFGAWSSGYTLAKAIFPFLVHDENGALADARKRRRSLRKTPNFWLTLPWG